MSDEEEKCEKCQGKGIVKDKTGVHVCFDCLRAGRLDCHSKKIPESKIRL